MELWVPLNLTQFGQTSEKQKPFGLVLNRTIPIIFLSGLVLCATVAGFGLFILVAHELLARYFSLVITRSVLSAVCFVSLWLAALGAYGKASLKR